MRTPKIVQTHRGSGKQNRRWKLVAGNNEIQCSGEAHGSRSAVNRAIRKMIVNLLATPPGRRILRQHIKDAIRRFADSL